MKRAQFNKKVNEMTASLSGSSSKDSSSSSSKNSSSVEDDKRPQRRTVSVETRRFAAIRLAATNTTYQQELARMVRKFKRNFVFF